MTATVVTAGMEATIGRSRNAMLETIAMESVVTLPKIVQIVCSTSFGHTMY